jgi:hypothetical protein
LKEQNVAIEIIVESTGLSYEAIQRIWVSYTCCLRSWKIAKMSSRVMGWFITIVDIEGGLWFMRDNKTFNFD